MSLQSKKRLGFLLTFLACWLGCQTAQAKTRGKPLVLLLEGEINHTMAVYVQEGFEKAEMTDAPCVVLVINTPGGDLWVAGHISNQIMRAKKQRPVYAFIRDHAISAGALIAMAATKTYMSEYAIIGACTVIQTHLNRSIMVLPLKFQAIMKVFMRKVAKSSGKPYQVLEGMVIGTDKNPEPVVLTSEEAIREGVCDGVFRNINQILAYNGVQAAEVVIYRWFFLVDWFYAYMDYVLVAALVLAALVGQQLLAQRRGTQPEHPPSRPAAHE